MNATASSSNEDAVDEAATQHLREELASERADAPLFDFGELRDRIPDADGCPSRLRSSVYSVALLPGDGVGIEVIAEARKAVDALGVEIAWTEFPWGAAHHAEHGAMMPPDWAEMLRAHDAILLGACGWPTLPDHVTVWGMTLLIRQTLDLWANVRPARLLPGIPTPLAGRGPADLDMLFLRENTEGEYAGVGGRSHRGLPLEVALETSVFTRAGTERVVRYGFELAAGRRGVLISATKSNASRFGYVLWDEIVEEVSADFPDIQVERMLVDALAARVVRDPGSIDVVVGVQPFRGRAHRPRRRGHRRPRDGRKREHRSGKPWACAVRIRSRLCPGHRRQGGCEPDRAIWSSALMLEHLGDREAAGKLITAIEQVCADGPKTRDVGGSATTSEVGDAVAAAASGPPSPPNRAGSSLTSR